MDQGKVREKPFQIRVNRRGRGRGWWWWRRKDKLPPVELCSPRSIYLRSQLWTRTRSHWNCSCFWSSRRCWWWRWGHTAGLWMEHEWGMRRREEGGELAKWWRLPTTRVNLFSRFALVRFSISISIIFDKSLLGSQRHHHQHRHHPQAPPPPLESFSFATSQHQKHENERRAVTLEFIPFAFPLLAHPLLCSARPGLTSSLCAVNAGEPNSE